MSQKSYRDNKNKLYLVPTPLGNLGDMTIRAIEVLKMVDIVFCEDTRVTKELLKHFEITKKWYLAMNITKAIWSKKLKSI